MTTTVCDLVNRIITADTRWSCRLPATDGSEWMVYCDDTGFDKISVVGDMALITAGDGKLIAEWKTWWAGDADPKNKPATERDGENSVNIAIVDLKNNAVLFDAGQKHVLFCEASNEIKAFASGSGGIYAAANLLTEGCAKKAITHASDNDYYTSDVVSFACYKSNQNNLSTETNYDVIVDGILTRGNIMQLQQTKPSDKGMKLSDHPHATEIAQLFKDGKAVASAPVPGLSAFKWTQETEDRFSAAMQRVHESRS